MAQNQGLLSGIASPEEIESLLDKEMFTKYHNPQQPFASALGLGFAKGVGIGKDDPRMQQAKELKVLKDTVSERAKAAGISEADPEQYAKIVYQTAIELDKPDIAFMATMQARQSEIERRKIKVDEERNRILENYYEGIIAKKDGKDPKKKAALPSSVDVKNVAQMLQGREEFAGMDAKQMANLSVRVAARIKELETDDPDLSFGESLDIALSEASSKIKRAKKKGWYDTGGEVGDQKWWEFILGRDQKAEYDDSSDPIKGEDVPATSKETKAKPTGDRVEVVNSKGEVFTIPSSQVELAKKKGYKIKK